VRQRQDNVLDVRYEFLIDGGLKSRQNSGQDKDKLSSRQRLTSLLYTLSSEKPRNNDFTPLKTPKTMAKDYLLFCLGLVVLYLAKARAKTCAKDCLCLLSLSSSLLAMIKPFLKLPSFDLQKPLDNSLGRSLFCRHFADKLFSTQ